MATTTLPELSIIIPLRNQAARIARALDSVAAQDIPLELIIVNDASSDASAKVTEDWLKKHPEIPCRLVQLQKRSFALQARLEGMRLASAANILFLDADDVLTLDGSLARILQRKLETGAEIAHFRSLGQANGEMCGEVAWAAPMREKLLLGEDIFREFTSRPYPPWVAWGKIFSLQLLQSLIPWLEKLDLRGAEDALLLTLAMAKAQSYLGCGEYAYIYSLPSAWPMRKFARRVQGEITYAHHMARALRQIGLSEKLLAEFLVKFEAVQALPDAGRLALQFEERLFNGEEPEKILAELEPLLDEKQLFTGLLLAGHANASRLVRIARRYYRFDDLDGRLDNES